MGMKQKNFFFLKKKIQNGRLKKTSFFNSVNSQYFFVKISWIRPWVSRIDWCKGHQCGSTYIVIRLSDRQKNAKQYQRKHMQHSVRTPYVVQNFWIMSFSRWDWKKTFLAQMVFFSKNIDRIEPIVCLCLGFSFYTF